MISGRLPFVKAEVCGVHIWQASLNLFEIDLPFQTQNDPLPKFYGQEPEQEKRYSPAKCTGAEKHRVMGNPDAKAVSTSFVERQNLTMRMSMRRFTRLTNGFSKKVEYLECEVALHFMYYNFVRPHQTLANPYPRTPAMAAGITDHIWTTEEIVSLREGSCEMPDYESRGIR